MMKQKRSSNMAAKAAKYILDKCLVVEANSAATVIFYQPEEPKGLAGFKRVR